MNYKKYCPEHYEEIKNYELAKADNFVGWVCHHINGEEFPTEWLKKNNMYYNRTDPHEFVFLRTEEHTRIHRKGKEAWNRGIVTKPYIYKTNIRRTTEMKEHLSNKVKSKMKDLVEAYHKDNKGLSWNEFQRQYNRKE